MLCACPGSSPGSGGGGSADTLAGVWDGVGTGVSSSKPVTVTLQPGHLLIDHKTHRLEATAKGDDFDVSLLSVGHFGLIRTSPGTLSLGSFPIALSGGWNAVDPKGRPDYGCSAALTGSSLEANCLRVLDSRPTWLDWLPDAENRKVKGQRLTWSKSIFGDLGGKWHVTEALGASCDLEFNGAAFDATCKDEAGTPSSLHVQIEGTLMSGYTSTGVEFSAHRR